MLSGCSLLINLDHNQCTQQSDCTRLGLPGPCVQGVCELTSATCDGGADCQHMPDAGTACSPMHPCPVATDACFKQRCADKAKVEDFICPAPDAGAIAASSAMIPLTVHVQDIVSGMPPRGLVVSACKINDFGCGSPVATWIDNRTSGDVVLQLPHAFEGFLQVVSDTALTGLYFLTKPLTSTLRIDTLRVITPDTLAMLSQLTGLTADDSKGMVVLQGFDCADKPAGGLHFEASSAGDTPFYVVNGLPNTASELTVRDDAQNLAAGGFLNVGPGFQIFSARIGVNGPLLGQFNASVRANTITYLDLHP